MTATESDIERAYRTIAQLEAAIADLADRKARQQTAVEHDRRAPEHQALKRDKGE